MFPSLSNLRRAAAVVGARAPAVAQSRRQYPHETEHVARGWSNAFRHEVETGTLRRRAVQAVAPAFPSGAT